MNRDGQALIELATSLILLWVVMRSGKSSTAREMARWDRVRRIATHLARYLGNLAIYAEHRYNQVKA